MGMFDTVLVAEELIHESLKDVEEAKHFISFKGYYNFQTKDLDNCLDVFFIQSDGSFVLEEQEQKWIEGDKNAKFPNNLGHMEPVGEPTYTPYTKPAYIRFYDFYNTDTDAVSIEFVAHVKDGKLVEPIKLKRLEKTNLEQQAIATKKSREKWNKITSTWEWRLATFLFDARYKVKRFFFPFTKSLDKLDSHLRDRAKSYETSNI